MTSKRSAAAYDKLRAARAVVSAHNRNFQSIPRSIGEKKNIDTAIAFPAFGVITNVITTLNACTAAATPTSRVGRHIKMSSLLIRGYVGLAATSTGACPVRILVVYDKQTNKLAPGATDVLAQDGFSYPMSLQNSRRFKVVFDKQYPFMGTAGPQGIEINEYIKLNLDTEFIDGAGAGTVADITSGGLFALVSLGPNVGVATVLNNVQARVRFTDL